MTPTPSDTPDTAERIARAFHEAYERLAPDFGYTTREASAKPWADVPEQNKRLMIAVVADLLQRRVIADEQQVFQSGFNRGLQEGNRG
jgi:hypothetical protein